MKILYSICIYEFPAATYDISHWAERFKDQISHSIDMGEILGDLNVYHFEMKLREDKKKMTIQEDVYCIPHYRFHDAFLQDTMMNLFPKKRTKDNRFFKLILVGSFNSNTMHKILVLTDFFKSQLLDYTSQ